VFFTSVSYEKHTNIINKYIYKALHTTTQGTGQDEEPYNTTSKVKCGSWLVHEQGRVTETGIHRVITDKRRNYYFYVGLMSVSLL
jgi:hypothetical protein